MCIRSEQNFKNCWKDRLMNRKTTFLAFVALILVFSGTYIYACHSSRLTVAEIEIKGNNKIPLDEIRKKAEWCLGKNIFSLNLTGIEEELKEDVRVKDVRVKRNFPQNILIEVEEKVPILWISFPTNFSDSTSCGFYGLSIDQEIIPLEKKDLLHDLPIVSGIEIEATDTKACPALKPYQIWSNSKVKKALESYKTLTTIDPSSAELLAEINLGEISNPVLYLLPRIKVIMGQGDFEQKWRRVRTILAGEEKIEEFLCLDLRFDDQVVVSRSSKRFSSRGVHYKNLPQTRGDENL